MSARRLLAALLVSAGVLAGCGYADDNDDAAVAVTAALLDAADRGDEAAACGLLAPELRAALDAQDARGCPVTVRFYLRQLRDVEAGRAKVEEPRSSSGVRIGALASVPLSGEADGHVGLGRYGSIWRVNEIVPRR